MAAKFKRGKLAVYVTTLPHRMFPSLIVDNDGSREIVASFKSDESARLFKQVLTAIMRGGKDADN